MEAQRHTCTKFMSEIPTRDFDTYTLNAGGSRAAYNTAKRTSNRAVHQARSEAEKVALKK